MLGFAARRLVAVVPVLVGVSLLVFGLTVASVGEPARAGLSGPRADALARDYALDEPIWVQYRLWAGRLLRGDLGRSSREERPVSEIVGERLPSTLRLAVAAAAIALVLGVAAGTLAAARRGGATDFLLMTGALVGVSTPVVWLGLMLILVFAVWLGWLPAAGAGDGGWRHLVLPALALGALHAGAVARIARASLLEVTAQPYLRTARAKGLSEAAVLVKHVLRNALLPVLTVTGLGLADLLVGAPLAETVFDWPGLGRLLVTAVGQRDLPVVMAAVLLFALLHLAGSVLVDLARGLADPRLRA